MNITLEYDLPGGRTRRVWLNEEQILRFGSSNHADVVIDSDARMSAVHFAVTGLGHQWQISSVGSENAIFVNGAPANFHSLEHGDTVQAGGTIFRVTIEGFSEPVDPVPEDIPQPPPPPEPKPLEYSIKHFTSRVTEFSISATDLQLPEILNALGTSQLWPGSNSKDHSPSANRAEVEHTSNQYFCALNAKRLGRPLATLQVTNEKDLFAHAPDEIRETDSLAIQPVPMPLKPTVVQELTLAYRANASFLILSPQPLDEYLEAHKLVWGWYGRPKILHHQISLGSSMLAEKLLLGNELIVLFGTTQNSGFRLLVQKADSERLAAALNAILI